MHVRLSALFHLITKQLLSFLICFPISKHGLLHQCKCRPEPTNDQHPSSCFYWHHQASEAWDGRKSKSPQVSIWQLSFHLPPGWCCYQIWHKAGPSGRPEPAGSLTRVPPGLWPPAPGLPVNRCGQSSYKTGRIHYETLECALWNYLFQGVKPAWRYWKIYHKGTLLFTPDLQVSNTMKWLNERSFSNFWWCFIFFSKNLFITSCSSKSWMWSGQHKSKEPL